MTTTAQPALPADVVERLRAICAELAGAYEHAAWTGTSWRVGTTTFAHVVHITDGRPAAYGRAFRTDGPAIVVTFQADPDERRSLGQIGPPFHLPVWRPGIVGLLVDQHTDWDELAELVTESHRSCATDGRPRRR